MFAYLIRRTPMAAVAALAAASLGGAAKAPSVVTIGNFTFAAPVVTVPVGATVTWVNGDDVPHTVVATDKSFRSKVLDTDDRFSFTFTRAGSYDYFCSIHPHMTGKVVVTAS
ncbi:cupredoxin family copper-binding protein [Phenylobacterium sp.]|uniref:cupredoxin domain-containing protein n=1 Tax=Phenylobacterium sp. TaxID=1871053 RepID=UPI002F40195E